jgi:hypothetical protein
MELRLSARFISFAAAEELIDMALPLLMVD